MKRKSLLSFMLLCFAFFGVARAQQIVEIGEQTATNNYLPTYSYYNYSMTQQIYTADEIGMAGTISSIAFKSTGSEKTRTLDIYLVNTDKESFSGSTDWITATADDLVYSGDVTFTTGEWITLDLDNVFVYEGTSNLAVIVDDNTGSFSSGLSCGVFDASNMAIRVYSDDTNYNPTAPSYNGTVLSVKNVLQFGIIPPGGSVCEKPETFEVSNITKNSADLEWTGGSGSYEVEYKNASDQEWTTAYYNTHNYSVTINGLEPGKTYNVRVQSLCEGEEIDPETGDYLLVGSGWKTASFMTSFGIPLVEGFNTSSAPNGWSKYTGLLSDVLDGTALSTTTSGWSFGSSSGVFDSHAKVNIYGTTCKYWLVTPSLPMEYNVQLTFDMALTKYSGTLQPVDPTQQADDKFVVLITTDGGTTWEILRQWDNEGSDYVYNDIACSATGQGVAIDLSSYADQNIAIAFYGESTVTGNGDNYLHIDNVSIDYIPACAKPTGLAVSGVTAHEATISWESDANEWHVMLNEDEENLIEVMAENTYTLTGLLPETTYTVKVRTNCTNIASGYSEWTTPMSFTTAIACPVPTSVSISEIAARSAVVNWISDADDFILMLGEEEIEHVASPYLLENLTPETSYTVKVKAVCGDEDGESQWTNGTNFTTTVACPAPTNLTCTAVTVTSATLSWVETGSATSWDIQYSTDASFDSYNSAQVNDNTTITLENLTPETVYYARVQAYCGGEDGVSSFSSTVNFEPTAKIIIGSGTATSNYLPSNTNYDYSFTQQIYTAEELGEAGIIESIDFFMTSTSNYTRNLDVYMVSTEKNNFESNTDWIAVTATDLVFSGEVNFAAQAWTTITFDEGFIYDGTKNVVIIVDDNTGVYSSRYFKAFNVGTNQAIYKYRDNTDIPSDFAENGTLTSNKNQVRILKSEMPDCVKPTHLTATEIGPDFAILSWIENGESTEWNVEITDVIGGQSTNWTAYEIPFTIPGLSNETEYSVRVSPTCDENLWSTAITITTLAGCPVPSNVEVSDITYNSATVTWTGYTDSYTVFYGWSEYSDFINEDFADGIPVNWTNDETYPWIIEDGYIQSGNAGVHNSTSVISFVANYDQDGTIDFDAQCMGEGTSWDVCKFSIDDNVMFTKGANGEQWDHYTFPVEYGEHTFTFAFSKDGSENGNGDHFAVDNIVLSTVEPMSGEPVIVEGTEYILTGLNPNTEYEVMVNGICGDLETEWSETVYFQTPYITKEITGYGTGQGNYYLIASPIGTIHPTEVTNMLANEYDLYAFQQVNGEEWLNYKNNMTNFYLEPGKGYLYANSEDISLIFNGVPYNLSGEVTLEKVDNTTWSGWNLVGNPFYETAYIGDRDFYIMNSDGSEIIKSTSSSIEAMEGVFVIAEEDGEILTFSTEAPAKSAMLSINLSQGSSIVDCAAVRFGIGRCLPKLQLNPNSTKVYIPLDNVDYAVVLSESTGELPVNFKTESNGSYTMSFVSEEVEFSYLHLIDNVTGNDVDLLATSSYTFNARTSDNANRFKLAFALGTTGINENFAYYNNGNFIINNEGKAILQVIDVTGRILTSDIINGSGSVNVKAAPGVYMLRLINGDNVKVQKMIVR